MLFKKLALNFLNKFIDNFVPCEHCEGSGYIGGDTLSGACDRCGGTKIQISSKGLLLSELYGEAVILKNVIVDMIRREDDKK